jgi:hypothetical protein
MRERKALEILEQSVSLLRAAPAGAVAAYLTGTVPFSLALLFFLTDMVRSPFAAERLVIESLGLAVLYLWKSVWQAVFVQRLHERLAPRLEGAPATAGRWKMIATQCAIQPLGLIVIPFGLLLTIPFASIVAFFRNVALFSALGKADAVATARRQAVLWQKQNWCALTVVSLAALLLFVNVTILFYLVPQLGRSFLGIEGDLARLGTGILNMTTLSAAAVITWMILDPLLDAMYVLRCFYGASLATGEDLSAAFRQAVGTLALLAISLAVAASAVRAQTPPPPAQPAPSQQSIEAQRLDQARLDQARLDQAIDQTIRKREFTWREPRADKDEPQGRIAGWIDNVLHTIGRGLRWIGDRIDDWLRSSSDREPGGAPGRSPRALIEIWGAAVAVVLLTGAFVFFRRSRRNVVQAEAVLAAAPAVNLADESLTADKLPESSWLELAEQCLARGEYRAAMRALYLAGINCLSSHDLVSIRRWKTGLDYRRELERRARANSAVKTELAPLFARNVAVFERGWYGRHAIDRADVEAFAAGVQEMRRHAGGI